MKENYILTVMIVMTKKHKGYILQELFSNNNIHSAIHQLSIKRLKLWSSASESRKLVSIHSKPP